MQTTTPRPEPEFLMPYGENQALLITGPFKHLERPPMGWLEFAQKCEAAGRDPWTDEAFADWLRLHGVDE